MKPGGKKKKKSGGSNRKRRRKRKRRRRRKTMEKFLNHVIKYGNHNPLASKAEQL